MAPKSNNIFNLIQVVFIVLSLVAAVEYFKYSTRINYDWFHCTPQVTTFPNSSIKQVISVGGPSCDKRGQTKSITKRLSREFEPNQDDVLFCIQDDGNKIIGFGSKFEDKSELESYCANIIAW
ncbi:ceramide synthase accessory subunit [Wickerhamomyces ciferrii]|uniref:Ceramide synthase accessory subunit n=2 Tax=Wickerhamomyces ciferrii TaxID=1041607 RepID=K0L069_WICCF|nr:ceramide synthase accessory subunit [Wickerhamomyces ciferrii]ADW79429.1 ceramide synthase accessory subunit [Wickerhamomyces ciferrii]CCH46778.1 ceramide synthase accessory subunit [Wickerhamomyces ciferrii]